MKKTELLSPAGNMECLKYAVQNGADAVYLGLNRFNARENAENFDTERLSGAIAYAHTRGVRVYVAFNTLMDDNEISQAVELAKEADRLHADAFIVQDIGFSRILKKSVKAPLHASTQMTIYNAEGLKTLSELGFSRCILSRELSLKEISEICEKNIMETEVFCHGAICISYSGQCLLSSFIGGRSGNKGICAQPCRLKYALMKNGKEISPAAFRISPADLCTLTYLKCLLNTGIASLKIEGRLKSPEYTGIVTKKYRKALDIIELGQQDSYYVKKDLDDLSVIFSRGKFTSYHHFEKMPFSGITFKTSGRIGLACGEIIKVNSVKGKKNSAPDIFELKVLLSGEINKGDGITIGDTESGGKINSVKVIETGKSVLIAEAGQTVMLNIAGSLKKAPRPGTAVYKTYDEALIKELNMRMQRENRKIPVDVYISIKPGEPVILKLSDGKREVTAIGERKADAAKNRAITKGDVEKQISRLGNTVYKLRTIETDLTPDVFIPVSEFSNVRRQAVDKLTEARINNAEGKQ